MKKSKKSKELKESKTSKILLLKFTILLFLFSFLLTGCSNNEDNTLLNSTATRTGTDLNVEDAQNRLKDLESNYVGGNITKPAENENEKEISNYSTVIKDKSEGRLANIKITCDAINGTIINPGETFSFNEVVGEPTTEKGYQEATIIIDHKYEKGLGGGNCQVSSTLYNSVLNIQGLTIIERHEHGKDVTYVPEGKDAAVSYGSLDLKFRNDTPNKIRIEMTTDDENITAKLYS